MMDFKGVKQRNQKQQKCGGEDVSNAGDIPDARPEQGVSPLMRLSENNRPETPR